jgi:tRNA-specific 2-thiouridylase
MLWKKQFTISDVSWVGDVPSLPLTAGVTIRYHHPDYQATIEKITDFELRIKFDEAQRAITPGQAAVIYQGEELLGGGIIEKVS